MPILSEETIRSYRFLMKWTFLAMLTGTAAALVVWPFAHGLLRFGPILVDAFGHWWFAMPIVGALLVALLFYSIEPEASGEGMPAYIVCVNFREGYLKPAATLFKYLAAFTTLLFGGSGGVVGPLSRVSAGVSYLIGKALVRVGLPPTDLHIAAVCGVAGAVSAILKTPIGAGIFAVEILRRRAMQYSELFPSLLASFTAFIVTSLLPEFSFFPRVEYANGFFDLRIVPWFFVIGIVCGILGLLYIGCFELLAALRGRISESLLTRVLIGGAAIALLGFVAGPIAHGTGTAYFKAILNGHLLGHGPIEDAVGMLALFVAIKIIATSTTIASGLSAGFTGPAILIGALSAATLGGALGLEGAAYTAFLAAGVAGMLAATMNVPIAATVIGLEMFGLSFGGPALVGSIVAFQVARAKTIYQLATSEDRQFGEVL